MEKENRIPLSVAIVTKNEEKNIRECLGSVMFASDIVVVDSGSTDATRTIAAEAGCRVFVEDWKGYGPQKNSALSKCKFNWALMLDADERVPEFTAEAIAQCIENDEGVAAFSFRRKNFFHGRWVKHCGWWPDATVRLARRSMGRSDGLSHDKWLTDGRVVKLTAHIEHYSFRKYDDVLRIMRSRAADMAQELYDSGKRISATTPILHGMVMFLKTYILRLGFLAGFDGLVISLTRAGGNLFQVCQSARITADGLQEPNPLIFRAPKRMRQKSPVPPVPRAGEGREAL
jgi:glycosyltransferase involved in cell wall biosynthesis